MKINKKTSTKIKILNLEGKEQGPRTNGFLKINDIQVNYDSISIIKSNYVEDDYVYVMDSAFKKTYGPDVTFTASPSAMKMLVGTVE